MKPTWIEFVRVERECPHNTTARKEGRRLIYDYEIKVNGERRAAWHDLVNNKGYSLVDSEGQGIKENSSDYWYGMTVKKKADFLPTIERLLAAGKIPTLSEVKKRSEAEAKEKAAKLAKHRNRVEIKIGIVGHGYQIDIYNYARSIPEQIPPVHTSACGDFADNYEPGDICDAIQEVGGEMMQKLEEFLSKLPKRAATNTLEKCKPSKKD